VSTIEAVIGSNFADTILGDAANNYLSGRAGNDTILGAGGSDSLLGGAGADRFVFRDGDGYDAIFGFESGVDVIDATAYAAGDPDFDAAVFEYGSDLVIAFGNGDNLYMVSKSLSTFNKAADLLL